MNKELAIQVLKDISMNKNVLLCKTDHFTFEKVIEFIEEEFKKLCPEQNNNETVNN
jgi:hypothetical protein